MTNNMFTYRIVLCVLTINCRAVVAMDTGPINSLKISIYKKNSTKGSSRSTLPVGVTVTATVNTTATIIPAGPMTRMMSGNVVTTNVPLQSTNNNNDKIINCSDNALIQKLCSALMHVATTQQNRQEMRIEADHARRSSAAVVATGNRCKSQRKPFKKKFPPPTETGNYDDFSDTTVRPEEARYKDPIMAQEFSRMDYRTTVDPLENELSDGDVEEKYDKVSGQQPAKVWNTVVTASLVAESMKNNNLSDKTIKARNI